MEEKWGLLVKKTFPVVAKVSAEPYYLAVAEQGIIVAIPPRF
jgi:hypothetical protein